VEGGLWDESGAAVVSLYGRVMKKVGLLAFALKLLAFSVCLFLGAQQYEEADEYDDYGRPKKKNRRGDCSAMEGRVQPASGALALPRFLRHVTVVLAFFCLLWRIHRPLSGVATIADSQVLTFGSLFACLAADERY
jgi:hypothetical protein